MNETDQLDSWSVHKLHRELGAEQTLARIELNAGDSKDWEMTPEQSVELEALRERVVKRLRDPRTPKRGRRRA